MIYKTVFGSAIGAGMGVIKGVMLSSTLTAVSILDTVVLAGIGAIVGFIMTSLLKSIKIHFENKAPAPRTGSGTATNDTVRPPQDNTPIL